MPQVLPHFPIDPWNLSPGPQATRNAVTEVEVGQPIAPGMGEIIQMILKLLKCLKSVFTMVCP